MLGLPLAFATPAVLFGLIALPVIWWLLRLTPPRPRSELFPPLRILARIARKQETPSKSPWWLTALRLALAALVIAALADPVLNPRENAVSGDGPLAVVIDNGWSTAPGWQDRIDAAGDLIDDAEQRDIPVAMVFTADAIHDATPTSAAAARERLAAAAPAPLHADRTSAIEALDGALDGPAGTLAFLSDGVAPPGTGRLEALSRIEAADRVVYAADGRETLAITTADNAADAFFVTGSRLEASGAARYRLLAHDIRGRAIAEGTLEFAAGETAGAGRIVAPFELRNDFARLSIEGVSTAGTSYLLDDSFRRRRVALLSGTPTDLAQPLLSPLYYIANALEPYADLVRPESAELSEAIPELLDARPSVIVMADIGTLPDDAYAPLTDWIEDGGMLLRFAGPRLAGAAADDPLVPVSLRQGERALGGSLSWTEPQPLAPFPPESPFSAIPVPEDVVVSRQVLAEPSPDLAANTWASLRDGTPLVTSRSLGEGRIVLFHVTAEATWSNLPISGGFVEMLRRTVMLSSARAPQAESGAGEPASGPSSVEGAAQTLPPYRLLDANGLLTEPSGAARPIAADAVANALPSAENPPGLYGNREGFSALNLMREEDGVSPLRLPENFQARRSGYALDAAIPLKPWLLAFAMTLLIVDTLVVLFMSGALARLPRPTLRDRRAAAALVGIGLSALFLAPSPALAQSEPPGDDSRPGDAAIIEQLDATSLAYVVTGDESVDEISRDGLSGLTQFLTYRTALEPGQPVGVDLESDPLELYPLIYWPMTTGAPMPSDEEISRIDAFMKSGGTVLFDTRDQFSGLDGSITPETERLRAILAGLDIPPLEPVPSEHVLTKAFYLLAEFPGRYRGGEMWIEQRPDDDSEADRSLVSADGVTSVIITGNDLAGAWALDENGAPMFPTVPADPAQREYAFRTGVNIMMYMLTGNYKTDQVHVPALLERLGQ